jgi:uncharacterized protein with PIN domain/sulfur carrier protein ThiS
MLRVTARFYAELNDFLPPARRGKDTLFTLPDSQQINDFLSSNGIPPANVDLFLCNGRSVTLDHALKDGDRVSCYPVFETFDIRSVTKIRTIPLRIPRFILDVHLGKLASFLRMLGFDTLYFPDTKDDQMLSISLEEERTLLSKDRDLLHHESLIRGYHVLADDPREQIAEVVHRFDLFASFSPFTRCIRCNTLLEPVEKEKIIDRIPPKVRQYYDEYFYCCLCDHIFWKGSHYEKMKLFVEEIRGER